MNIILTPHNGCYNHGCEAIVRSTVELIGDDKDIFLYSTDIENDKKFGLNNICTLIKNDSNSMKISWIKNKWFAVKEKVLSNNRDLEEISFRNKNILFDKKNSLVLSIGGDNYCYAGMQHVLSEQMKLFSYNDINCVLWGCSIEEGLLRPEVIDDLKKYKLITVRESISREILNRNGIINTVVQCVDPAFVLEPEYISGYDYLLEDKTIGINLSPLMKSYDSYTNATYENFYTLIKYILEETNFNIMLIPHVRQPGNDDLEILKKLKKDFADKRVNLVSDDLNAMQLKYLISKCRMFIGCRTHATIAAYSTCVPTLAVGYSTKSKGICKDIFGNYDELLIDARNFTSGTDLQKKFSVFVKHENEYRDLLKAKMQGYRKKVYTAVDALNVLIDSLDRK